MKIFGTKTFVMETDVMRQAFKVCEEAFELYMAAKHRNVIDPINDLESRRRDMVYEGADVIQAVLNFFDMLGMDEEEVDDAMYACYRRNVNRGRVK